MSQVDELQLRAAQFVVNCFGKDKLLNKQERGMRVLEESAELAQAFGVSADKAIDIVLRTYSRPIGVAKEELAGVASTLLSAATAENVWLYEIIEESLNRLENPNSWEKRRTKHAEKVKDGVAL